MSFPHSRHWRGLLASAPGFIANIPSVAALSVGIRPCDPPVPPDEGHPAGQRHEMIRRAHPGSPVPRNNLRVDGSYRRLFDRRPALCCIPAQNKASTRTWRFKADRENLACIVGIISISGIISTYKSSFSLSSPRHFAAPSQNRPTISGKRYSSHVFARRLIPSAASDAATA
jgi:hypothetical protein